MAKAHPRQIAARFPYATLRRPLSPAARASVARQLAGLVAWQRTLARWPATGAAPDATPFVSLYVHGRLVGCAGSDEGAPGERLARAFLRAVGDSRLQAIAPDERAELAAQVSYLIDARPIERSAAKDAIEPGTHGVAFVSANRTALLLPQVARDHGWEAAQLLDALAQKADLPRGALQEGLHIFRAETATCHRRRSANPLALAGSWLAGLVAADGAVTFAIDPRRRAHQAIGVMHHGRAAVVVRALAGSRRHAAVAARAESRLERDIRAALNGSPVEGWPAEPAMVAGTLALACLAGLGLKSELRDLALRLPELARAPWHAAQVVTALGDAAPAWLWRACVRDLERRGWAPWTALAAARRGDRTVLARVAPALISSIRERAPHQGGVNTTPIPEIALTALTAEALRTIDVPEARRAGERARAFLRRWQLLPNTIPASLSAELALGAFPASPTVDLLRGDITAHALLALASSLPT